MAETFLRGSLFICVVVEKQTLFRLNYLLKSHRKWGQYKLKKNVWLSPSHLSLPSNPIFFSLVSPFQPINFYYSHLCCTADASSVRSDKDNSSSVIPPSLSVFSLFHFFPVPSFNFHFFFSWLPPPLSQNDAVWSPLFCHLSRLRFFSSFSLPPVSRGREQALWETINGLFFCSFWTIFQADSLWFMCPSSCLPEGHRAKHKRRSQSSISFSSLWSIHCSLF